MTALAAIVAAGLGVAGIVLLVVGVMLLAASFGRAGDEAMEEVGCLFGWLGIVLVLIALGFRIMLP